MRAVAVAGVGFLLAVLWFDLMFDVQIVGHREGDLPEPVLTSISTYYRRVTTDARPMNRLVATVMLATVGAIVAELIGRGSHWAAWVSLALAISAIALAGGRTVPSAVRLGARRDPLLCQCALARSICRDHVACLTAMTALLVIQLGWAR